jgi:hypothetical protein
MSKFAVKPFVVVVTLEAVYPGQTSWTLTACGSSTFGRIFWPISASDGMVKMGRHELVVANAEGVVAPEEAAVLSARPERGHIAARRTSDVDVKTTMVWKTRSRLVRNAVTVRNSSRCQLCLSRQKRRE